MPPIAPAPQTKIRSLIALPRDPSHFDDQRDHAPEAVEKLVEFMRGAVTVGSKQRGVAPRLQVQAALAILDRGLGKPAQQLLANREAAFDGPERVVAPT